MSKIQIKELNKKNIFKAIYELGQITNKLFEFFVVLHRFNPDYPKCRRVRPCPHFAPACNILIPQLQLLL